MYHTWFERRREERKEIKLYDTLYYGLEEGKQSMHTCIHGVWEEVKGSRSEAGSKGFYSQ